MGEKENRRRDNPNRHRYIPKGAQAHSYTMPPEVPSEAPGVIVRCEFLPHGKVEEEASMQRIGDCVYLTGSHVVVAGGTVVARKGQDGGHVQMISGRDPSAQFARKWLSRDKSHDRSEPGFDGEKLTLQQAWCKKLMAKPLYIVKGDGAGDPEPRHYRMRLNPDPSAAAKLAKGDNLNQFIREYMNRVQNDLQREVIWIGAGHYKPKLNLRLLTDEQREAWPKKPASHAHFAFRGVDGEGRAMFIEGQYWRKGLERRARGLLLEMFETDKKDVKRAG